MSDTLAASIPADKISMTLQQASNATGLCQRTIRNAITDNSLPAVYIGTRILLLRSDILAWLDSRRSSSRVIVRPDRSVAMSAKAEARA